LITDAVEIGRLHTHVHPYAHLGQYSISGEREKLSIAYDKASDRPAAHDADRKEMAPPSSQSFRAEMNNCSQSLVLSSIRYARKRPDMDVGLSSIVDRLPLDDIVLID